MNPHHNSIQNPASTPAVQQANSVINPQIFNGNVGGLFPNNNNMPVAAQPCFMNFPSQQFPLQNAIGHFPNGIGGFIQQQSINPFPVNQLNPFQQQQQAQFFAHNSMNPTSFHQNIGGPGQQQALLQNTIQNICQLLQLQNPNYTQCLPANIPMFQNQMGNVMNPQNPGFPVNQQFGTSTSKGPMQLGNNGSQNMNQQIPQGMGPQNHNLFTNQMFAMANFNNNMQNANQGQPGIVSPMMDANASRQIFNTGETHNSSPNLTNFESNHKNVPTNINGQWVESQHKNMTGHKTYDASHKGSKSHQHVKEKFGIYKGNMSKEGDNNLAADSASQSSTKFHKKIPSLTYTDQEIKEWCEARKRNHPANGAVSKTHKTENKSSDVTSQEAMLRRQQLKEILDKQAELGCEVADIPVSYLSGLVTQNPGGKKHERQQQNKRGKFHNKRKSPFQDRMAKKARPRDQNANHKTKREPSLLEKLLTEDIKREKNHLLQVFRFITANSFFSGEALRFPSVIVRETDCSVLKAEEEEEGEIID